LSVPERIAVLFNPGARQGRAAHQLGLLKETLAGVRLPYDLYITEDEAHLVRLATELPKRYPKLAAAGGDTTFLLIVDAWLRRGISASLGVIGLGSCNDVPRALGAANLERAVRRLRDGTARAWDAGRVEADGQVLGHFLGQAQAGAGVLLNHYVEARKARRDFLGRHQTLAGVVGLTRILSSPDLPLHLTIRTETEERRGSYLMALFGNVATTAAGFKALPTARPDDGVLDGLTVRPCPLPRFALLFALARRGRHLGRPEVETLQAPCFDVVSGAPIEVQADGLTLTAPDGRRRFERLTFRALPGALRIIV
jgi:diacylglycerol kinase (ATP)